MWNVICFGGGGRGLERVTSRTWTNANGYPFAGCFNSENSVFFRDGFLWSETFWIVEKNRDEKPLTSKILKVVTDLGEWGRVIGNHKRDKIKKKIKTINKNKETNLGLSTKLTKMKVFLSLAQLAQNISSQRARNSQKTNLFFFFVCSILCVFFFISLITLNDGEGFW